MYFHLDPYATPTSVDSTHKDGSSGFGTEPACPLTSFLQWTWSWGSSRKSSADSWRITLIWSSQSPDNRWEQRQASAFPHHNTPTHMLIKELPCHSKTSMCLILNSEEHLAQNNSISTYRGIFHIHKNHYYYSIISISFYLVIFWISIS